MVAVGEAIDSGEPLPANAPPQLPVYHFSVVPEPHVAVSEMLPLSSAHKLLRSTSAEVGATGEGTTVTVTLAHEELPQALSQRA